MRLLCTLMLCLQTILVTAQYEERPATLTNRNDETQQGFVRYYDWNENPTSIQFHGVDKSNIQALTVRDVKKLVISDGPVYEGLFLDVPYYAKGPIKPGSDPVRRVDSAYFFAELLLESEPVKLYRYYDADNKIRFVLAKYDSLVILNNIDVLLERRGAIFSYNLPEYRNILKTLLSECPTLNTETTLYTEDGILALVKEYLSFCRIDSKIYHEQKKLGRPIIGIGAYAGSWPRLTTIAGSDRTSASLIGISVQVLLPKRFNSFFVLADVGKLFYSENGNKSSDTYLGLYGGRYFGRRGVQAKVYTGLSTILGPFDTGVGVSYRRMVSIEARYPVFAALFTNPFSIPPLLSIRAIVPLSKQKQG